MTRLLSSKPMWESPFPEPPRRLERQLILTAPGLSVIIRGIEEARRTFERMMGYAYYRIAMTVSIMFFIVLIMVVYQVQILTPVMIILLALLDDVPVMLIAFDNAKVSRRPSKWEMRRVLTVSSMLALIGVVQSGGLLRVLHHRMGLDLPVLQTCMFMQLVIAGHLLLFSTRVRSFFFRPPFPQWKLFTAIMGTQLFAALMAAYGWLIHPISWGLIGYIWLYNLAWLFVVDIVKVALFHRMEINETGQAGWQKIFYARLDAYRGRLGKLA